MPFTPYHFGPGALVKAGIPKSFSLLVFVAAQVLMDFEPLYYIWKDEPPLHRMVHTYLGCHLVIAVLVFGVRPLLSWITRKPFPLRMTLVSAMIGAYSHVFLDSIMHSDITPLAPFSNANPLWHIVSLAHLHLFCLFSGVLGIVVLGIRNINKKSGLSL